MKKANILIAKSQNIYRIKVEGRATFETSPPLRNLAKSVISHEDVNQIQVNLAECTGMDSTFMGVLAMLGLEARKMNITIEIVNASAQNLALLEGLGLKKLFQFGEGDPKSPENQQWQNLDTSADILTKSKTVHDAHQTLVNVDPENNLPKFEKVIDFIKKDIAKFSAEPAPTSPDKTPGKDPEKFSSESASDSPDDDPGQDD